MLGARTVKAQVEHELVLPRQMRFLVPVEFSPVEKFVIPRSLSMGWELSTDFDVF